MGQNGQADMLVTLALKILEDKMLLVPPAGQRPKVHRVSSPASSQ
jgi:hypothetical protein